MPCRSLRQRVQRRDARSRVLLKCCEQRDYATRVLPASSYLDTGVRTIRARAADRRSERVSPSSTILHRDRPAAVALAVLVRGPLKAPSFDSSSVVVLYVGRWLVRCSRPSELTRTSLIVSRASSDPSWHAGADLAAKRRLTAILTAQSVTATAGKSRRRSSTRSPLEEKRAT